MTLAASWLACLADAVTYAIFLPQVLGAKKTDQKKWEDVGSTLIIAIKINHREIMCVFSMNLFHF